jgi:hypothetical protein
MAPLAVVVLAHADAPQVKRLIAALADTPVVLHCDARTPAPVFREMTAGLPERVSLAKRVRTTVTSWSLVNAELTALNEAVHRTGADHIAVLSGSDYPLLPMAEIEAEVAKLGDRTWIQNEPLPIANWGTPRQPDGGLWRVQYRYLTRDDQVIYYRGWPLRRPWRRPVPQDITLRGASQWKVYSRTDALALLKLADARPDLMRFWASTLVPDELFAASMLGSRRLRGMDALLPCPSSAWHLNWNGDRPGHPRWLSNDSFDDLEQARWATPLEAEGPGPKTDPACRKLFARKFRSTDPAILNRIDVELRDVFR